MISIPFNKPYLSGNELKYVGEAVANGKIAGDGSFTKKCHQYFEQHYGFKKAFLTTSCTDALEMAAILINIQPGDEVIAPSYTFVSTVNAFVLRGAKIVFADSEAHTPNLDVSKIEALITARTKAIVPVHYAGVACDMDGIMGLAKKYNLFVIEDAAQAVDAYYKDRPLGSIGHFGCFSFHETKNIAAGECGMLAVNDERFIARAEIIREKGTNRSSFFRGEVDKYGWVDVGSSFLPSDIIAAFLYAQLENLPRIQERRRELWEVYYAALQPLAKQGFFAVPEIPAYASNNAHSFHLICRSLEERTRLIAFLKENGVSLAFHYLSLHKSPYYEHRYAGEDLPYSDYYSDCLVRLPLFYELSTKDQEIVISFIQHFYQRS